MMGPPESPWLTEHLFSGTIRSTSYVAIYVTVMTLSTSPSVSPLNGDIEVTHQGARRENLFYLHKHALPLEG